MEYLRVSQIGRIYIIDFQYVIKSIDVIKRVLEYYVASIIARNRILNFCESFT